MTDFIQPQSRITQAQLDAQRRKGWPDFHPEDFCHRCGGPNIAWAAPPETWNPVMRPAGPDTHEWKWNEIICPVCFAQLAEANIASGVIWELRIHSVQHGGAKEFQAFVERYEEDL